MVKRPNTRLWPLGAIAFILVVIMLASCTEQQEGLLAALPDRGYLLGEPCNGLLRGDDEALYWVRVIGWEKPSDSLIYEYDDNGSTHSGIVHASRFENIHDVLRCMEQDPAMQAYRSVATVPVGGETVIPTPLPTATPAPVIEYIWVKPDGQRQVFRTEGEALAAARNSFEGGTIWESVNGVTSRQLHSVPAWTPPEGLNLSPLDEYFEWAGRGYQTLAEAVEAAKASFEGGRIQGMRRGEPTGTEVTISPWSPPGNLPNLGPTDPYFEWAGQFFYELEEALAAARNSFEGGEIKQMRRGEQQGPPVAAVPPWQPPPDLPDLQPLQPYFEWAGRQFRTLGEALAAARSTYEGGEVREIVRGEPTGKSHTVPPWQPPPALPELPPLQPYFEWSGQQFASEEDAREAMGLLRWFLGNQEIQRMVRGQVTRRISSPLWPKVALALLGIAMVLGLWWRRRQIKITIQKVKPNDIDAEAAQRIGRAGGKVGNLAFKIVRGILFIALVCALAYYSVHRLVVKSDFLPLIFTILVCLAYTLVTFIWSQVAMSKRDQDRGRNRKSTRR